MLPSAFTRKVKSALGCLEGVFSWPDDILIASTTWEEHLTTLVLVLIRLLVAGLSVVLRSVFSDPPHNNSLA